ncbi:ecto-ADP-ribosyltransferase 4-like [Etheostoma cragini]|uniref:ecto-ADP-ribosyltransferase 4-like n=1 Tax=Etheostoma cragini TaxID=417921 RepID=UPI00155F0BB7|nr:ecto-ADP-ribosyltransferase 4-like [Etheostoma cragini]
MKGNMMIFAPLCLLFCWILPVESKKITFIVNLPEAKSSIQMSMVPDAVDDMYFGCHNKMMETIKSTYFKKEDKMSPFNNVWKKAQHCANNKMKEKDDEALTKNHMQAICVYTSHYKEFYKIFNNAVRTNRKEYGTSFQFHSLHFWLTSAVQILSNNINCHTTYRRTNDNFSGGINQTIRFGFFASSSKKTTLTHFGKNTCFEIKTCFGAFLKNYSALKAYEQEVLIPPYEKFNITGKKRGVFVKGLSDCKDVYILVSAGVDSNLNCKAAYL